MAEVPLWPAQAEAVEFALARPAAMLDMGMGCGKTRVAIEVIRQRARRVLLAVANEIEQDADGCTAIAVGALYDYVDRIREALGVSE